LSEAARKEFFDFAQSLQNAAMFFKQRSEQSPHSSVSALLLQWEGDDDVSRPGEQDELEQVLRDKLMWKTERWTLPAVDPAAQLGEKLAQFFANAQTDHLRVVHYAGSSSISSENQLFFVQ
jgi:hypothetical protein